MKVLVSAPYFIPVVEKFRPRFEEAGIELIVPPVEERLEEAELLAFVHEIDGAICGDDRFTAKVLAAAPRLRVISKWGTGIDSIDLVSCRERGVHVCNTPDAFSDAVADSVLGYMLCFARNIVPMDRSMKDGVWSKIPGRALSECTLGIIGVGNVGRAIARRASAFGTRILGNDPVSPPDELLEETRMTMRPLDDLLGECDFVSLNCDLNPTSRGLANADVFRRMKPSSILINMARGAIVVESDLVDALRSGIIAGAALDVFEKEPLPRDSELLRMDNVLLAPHNSNSSPVAWERVHERTVTNLLAGLRNFS